DSDHIVASTVDIVAIEHIAADQSTALSDSKLIGDMTEVGLREAGDFGPQPIYLFHHALAAFEFRIGQIFRIRSVYLARDALGCAPGQEHLTVADGPEEPPALFDRVLDIFHSTHREP